MKVSEGKIKIVDVKLYRYEGLRSNKHERIKIY